MNLKNIEPGTILCDSIYMKLILRYRKQFGWLN